jgi:ABC-type nitrate/sulfonate/bicarbonate transport system substrate-binding protein
MGIRARCGIAALSALMFSGIVFASSASSQASEPKSIVVGIGVDPTFAPFVVAVKKGFFEKEGIKAQLKTFTDGNFALDALLTGDSDIGATSELAGLVRISKGGKLYVVASQTQSEGFNAVVGKASIAGPADLAGKIVGIPGRASGGNLFFDLVMKKYRIDPASITFKYLDAPESVAALSRGDVDAVAIWEPWPTRAMAAVPTAKVIVRSGPDLFPLTQYTYFSQRMVDDPLLAEASLRAIVAAADWILRNPEEAVKVVAEAYHMKPGEAEPIMKLVTYNVYFSTARFDTNFADAGAFGQKIGIFRDIPDSKTFLRPEFLQAVAPARVN